MKTPIDEAPAGPALDAACAEAMGLEVEWGYCHYNSGGIGFLVSYNCDPNANAGLRPVYVAHCVCDIIDKDDEYRNSLIGRHNAGCYEPVPEPSTRIEHAWKLVEAMTTGTGICFEIIRYEDGAYLCEFEKALHNMAGMIDWLFEGQSANSAPLAIARAFLKAHGVTEIEVPE